MTANRGSHGRVNDFRVSQLKQSAHRRADMSVRPPPQRHATLFAPHDRLFTDGVSECRFSHSMLHRGTPRASLLEKMQSAGPVDVSVVVPFGDDEDVIGTACQRLARHLEELGLAFEILAVDEDSGDNSHAILGLIRAELPQLRIVSGVAPGRGFAAGAATARGRVLWLIEPTAAMRSLAAFGRANNRVARGELELAVVRGCFMVAKRARLLVAVNGAPGRGLSFERRLVRRAQKRGISLEAYELGGTQSSARRLADRLRGRLALAFGAALPRL